MHYLVTGGCGFIGSHLIDMLASHGHSITVIDDLSTGKRDNITTDIEFIKADITSAGVFDNVVAKVDGCFHLAAIVSVPLSAEQWLRTHAVNQGGTVALFDAIVRSGRKIPVVLASSAAVYGDSHALPLNESAHCIPLSAYGVDKHACEWQAWIAAHIHDIPSIALRFFNVYGPRQDPASPYSGVISVFAGRMKEHKPVTIYGDGQQTRDFIYVADIVRGLAAAMECLERKGRVYGVYNLATGIQTTVNRLAQLMARLTRSASVISHGAPRTGDIRFSVGDPSSSFHDLSFVAQVALENGLERTVKAL